MQQEIKSLKCESQIDCGPLDAKWLRGQLSSLFDVLSQSTPAANNALSALISGEIILEEVNIPLKETTG